MKKQQSLERLAVVMDALRHWDPIGVIDMLIEDGLPPNEYDSYAQGVLEILERGESAKGISQHLAMIRSTRMGLGINKITEHEEEIGKKLVAWRESEYKNIPEFRFTRYAF